MIRKRDEALLGALLVLCSWLLSGCDRDKARNRLPVRFGGGGSRYGSLPSYYYGSAGGGPYGIPRTLPPVRARFDPFGGNYVMAQNTPPPNVYAGLGTPRGFGTLPPSVMVPGGGYSGSYGPGTSNLQSAAMDIARWPWFPYHPVTRGGRLGGAQVVSTILLNAGEIDGMHYDVGGLARHLRRHGWYRIPPPAIQPGDVVVWRTSRSHRQVGVVVQQGGRLCVVQNNSDLRRPITIPLDEYPYPAEEVLRKPGFA